MKGFETRCFFSNKENDWDKNKLDKVSLWKGKKRRRVEDTRYKDNDEGDDLSEEHVLCSV